ncbi:MAG TPA: thiamine-binding protein, partial [Salinivirgaceae bacterium]|nr:thiamine-binding protein [Salinivirgaceae bacterium]
EESEKALQAIDKAIDSIQQSGIAHLVCPFETVLEGRFAEVQQVMETAIEAALSISDELVIHCKWHISKKANLSIHQKIDKFR